MLDGCTVRGDLRGKGLDISGLASVEVGRYCLFREGSTIRPPVVVKKG